MRVPSTNSCLYDDFGLGARYFQFVVLGVSMCELYHPEEGREEQHDARRTIFCTFQGVATLVMLARRFAISCPEDGSLADLPD
jgi:hypothetical protein